MVRSSRFKTCRVFTFVIAACAIAGCGGGAGGGIPVERAVTQGSGNRGAMSATAIPVHIPTWAYDEYYANGANAPAWAVQKYVTYAEAGRGNPKAEQDCASTPKSCYSIYYFDPNFQYAGSTCAMQPDANFIAASSESWFVHEAGYSDFAHRVQGHYNQSCNGSIMTIPVYLANQMSAGVQASFQTYLQQNADAWDYYFMDDTSTRVLDQTYGPGGGFCQDSLPNHWCRTTQEYPTDSSVALAHAQLASLLNHLNGSPMQFFFNGIGFSGTTPINIKLLSMLPSRFMGGVCEACVVSAGTIRPSMFAPVLNAMAQVDALPGGSFVQLDTGASTAGSAAQIAQRTASIAMTWLGYKAGQTITWPDLEDNTKNLAVWPEDLIYPTAPIETMSTGAPDLAVAPGIYRREFSICYYIQANVGACAAIVNATASPVTIQASWLTRPYSNVITLSGGDVLNGGWAFFKSTIFTSGVTTVGPGQAILLGQ